MGNLRSNNTIYMFSIDINRGFSFIIYMNTILLPFLKIFLFVIWLTTSKSKERSWEGSLGRSLDQHKKFRMYHMTQTHHSQLRILVT